jgi:hypothetical protein
MLAATHDNFKMFSDAYKRPQAAALNSLRVIQVETYGPYSELTHLTAF